MKIHFCLAFLSIACLLGSFGIATGQIIISDEFNDGDLTTNTNGTGNGFEVLSFNGGQTPTESDGIAFLDPAPEGANGGHRHQINSLDSFDAASSTPIRTTFVVNDFGRSETFDGETTRLFVGLSQGTGSVGNAGVTANAVDGLWISFQSREDLNGTDNGQGALFYIDGTDVTPLGTWTWDQSLVVWDADSDLRSDRIATDLQSPLTCVLTVAADSYELSFSAATGTVPATVSGTFSELGLTNDLTTATATAASQTDLRGLFSFGSVTVEQVSDGVLLGDFDGDMDVDCDDLDGYIGNLGTAVVAGSPEVTLDIDLNGMLTLADANTHLSTLVLAGNGIVGTVAGDFDCSGAVDVLGDAFILVGNLGSTVISYTDGDANFNGTVDVLGDAFILVGNLGMSNSQ